MKERLDVCAATEKKRLAFGKARARRYFLESGFINTKYQQHFEVGGQPRDLEILILLSRRDTRGGRHGDTQ